MKENIILKGPFFIYIYPFENTFVDILINDIDYYNIDTNNEDTVLKYLINNKY